jgi:hypothetical protein
LGFDKYREVDLIIGGWDIGGMEIIIRLVDEIWIDSLGYCGSGVAEDGARRCLGVIMPRDGGYGFFGGLRNGYEIRLVRSGIWKTGVVFIHELGHLAIFLFPRIGTKTNVLMWRAQGAWDMYWLKIRRLARFCLHD